MKKLLVTAIVLVLVGTSMSLAKPAEATFNICHIVPALCQPTGTPTPTPTETPQITPQLSVTPTATGTPTPEPTENPCDSDEVILVLKDDEQIVPCETVTPTPEVTETPQPEQPLTQAGAPSCEGVSFVRLPANVHVVRNGDDADVRWTPTQGGEVSIFFFENEHPENRFGYKTDNDGHDTVHFLGRKNWTFEVQQWDGCATSGLIQVVDSSQSRLFRALPYLW